MSDNFFSRWSRRKQGLDTGEPPQAEPAAPQVPDRTHGTGPRTEARTEVHTKARTEMRTPGAAGQAPTAAAPASSTPAVPGASPVDDATPMPTMADVQQLTPSSDFQTFMREGVPGEVRNAAMKKLFTDPHFNVMDGLDIYIGDYNTPDPLPAGMLEKMVGAELLNLFPPKNQDPKAQDSKAHDPRAQAPALAPSAPQAQENPDQSPDAPQGASLVAQSPPSPTTPTLQTLPALQPSVPPLAPPEHDHPDLQLQPNHAPASPDPGPSAG